MKILEMVFLGLTIIVPMLFVILALIEIDKVKKSTKFRNTIIKLILLSFIINGIIFGAIKLNNDSAEIDKDNETKESQKENSNETDGEKEEGESHSDSDEEDDSMDNDSQEETDNKPADIEEKDPEITTKPNENTTTTTSTSTTSKGYKLEIKNGITYVDGYLIANKTYALPENFVPTNTYKNITSANCAECIDKDAYNAYTKMKSEATGLTLWIASGYRSYSYQNGLYTSYVNRSGQEAADTYSARPGHSEHQTGLAFDLNTVSDSFANTEEGKWIDANCHKYGFIIRYPKGKDDITGYKYEPWHLRYVGVDLATKLYNNGDWITMEEYFGITSKYTD